MGPKTEWKPQVKRNQTARGARTQLKTYNIQTRIKCNRITIVSLLNTTSRRGKQGTSWDWRLLRGLADCLPSARRRSNRINVTDVWRSAFHFSRRKCGSRQTDWRARGPPATHSATQAATNIAMGSSTFHVKCANAHTCTRTHAYKATHLFVCICVFFLNPIFAIS